ncbi:MAG: M20/M25/M40 family metallo-hydrolase, partial [Lentisphaeria bacterium]|nr:M20/M25/M40 family metallo-hydrolase [Lentisphaeria bacterium]
LAVLMICARYYREHPVSGRRGILFVANSGEEGLGNLKGSRKIMETFAGRVREFVSLDSACMNRLVTRAVGSHRYRVTVRTEGGHSFGSFGNRNAIHSLAAMITLLYSVKVPAEPGSKTTYNVGLISGGTSVNTIAQSAEMMYEYRSDSRACLAKMEKLFKSTIETFRATGVEVEVEKVGDRPCGGEVDAKRLEALRERYRASVRETVALEPFDGASSTDCNIPLSLGVPAICFGVCRSKGAHTREEQLDTISLTDGCRLLLDFLYRR